MMPSPNEPSAIGESHRAEFQRGDNGTSKSAGIQAVRRRNAQPGGILFVLFLAGFVLLIVLGKFNLLQLTMDVLRSIAAGLCVVAFVIARRAQRVPR